jgi:hypothetical protein
LRIERPARQYLQREDILIEHEERALSDQTDLQPIPQPPPYPVIGNLLDVRGEAPVLNLMKLAETYGPIYRLRLAGPSMVALSSFELVDQVCDNDHFDKFLGPAIKTARAVAGDGLFTAWTDEPNWRKHRQNAALPSASSRVRRIPAAVSIAALPPDICPDWKRGASAECFVRRPSVPFFPPAKPATPMIMVGAGTGIAPYRGFLQAPTAMKARGAPPVPPAEVGARWDHPRPRPMRRSSAILSKP